MKGHIPSRVSPTQREFPLLDIKTWYVRRTTSTYTHDDELIKQFPFLFKKKKIRLKCVLEISDSLKCFGSFVIRAKVEGLCASIYCARNSLIEVEETLQSCSRQWTTFTENSTMMAAPCFCPLAAPPPKSWMPPLVPSF